MKPARGWRPGGSGLLTAGWKMQTESGTVGRAQGEADRPVKLLTSSATKDTRSEVLMGERFRCYVCGQSFPLEEVRRRDGKTGEGHVGPGHPTGMTQTRGSVVFWTRVDLCPRCASSHDFWARCRLAFVLFLIAVFLVLPLVLAALRTR